MTSLDIGGAPPETELPAPDPAALAALEDASARSGADRRRALAAVAAANPAWPDAWAALGDDADDDVEAYAYFRVGYHRGLDALRKAGWRGSGYVRWAVPANRGFLRCLAGLGRRAAAIGEDGEAERCRLFLLQLDPTGDPGGR